MSYFFIGSESNYLKYRYEIYIHALNKRNTLPNIYIDMENGRMRLYNYIDIIKNYRVYGGDFELSMAYQKYNINIGVYRAIKNSDNNIINLEFLNYINNDNKED